MPLLIQATEMGLHIGDVPGAHKALLLTSGAFDPNTGEQPAASIVVPFDEKGWAAFQQMVASAGAATRIVPVGPEALRRLAPNPVPPAFAPPGMAPPQRR